jgi:hypothetical protein
MGMQLLPSDDWKNPRFGSGDQQVSGQTSQTGLSGRSVDQDDSCFSAIESHSACALADIWARVSSAAATH